jgi:hypothetical protein
MTHFHSCIWQPLYNPLKKLELIEGERYFLTLLHEIGYAYVDPDDSKANE